MLYNHEYRVAFLYSFYDRPSHGPLHVITQQMSLHQGWAQLYSFVFYHDFSLNNGDNTHPVSLIR